MIEKTFFSFSSLLTATYTILILYFLIEYVHTVAMGLYNKLIATVKNKVITDVRNELAERQEQNSQRENVEI